MKVPAYLRIGSSIRTCTVLRGDLDYRFERTISGRGGFSRDLDPLGPQERQRGFFIDTSESLALKAAYADTDGYPGMNPSPPLEVGRVFVYQNP
jgi:hypothetical protein